MKNFLKFTLFCAVAAGALSMASCDDNEPPVNPQGVQKYTITVTAGENGSASADMEEAMEGETVKLVAIPDQDYKLDKWVVTGGNAVLGDDTAGTTTFTMPAGNVEVRAEFVLAGVEPEEYTVTVTVDGTGGTAAATWDDSGSKQTAVQGTLITLTATPEEGYGFNGWTVVSGGVSLADALESPTTFYMGGANVEIKAAFIELTEDFDIFTDPVFRQYCVRFDTNNDGALSHAEIEAVTEINLNNWEDKPTDKAASLEGIGIFTNLKTLDCTENVITSLDLSGNTKLEIVNCSRNVYLAELNVRANTALKELYCYANALPSLDVTDNAALTKLECGTNEIASLDLSGNTELEVLSCGGSTMTFTSLDLSHNTKLTKLICNAIPAANNLAINLNGLTALNWLEIKSKGIKTLDVSTNSALRYIDAERGGLTYDAIIAMFNALPMRVVEDNAEINVMDCTGYDDLSGADKNVAKNKNWRVY